jgi:hypothetical protein
MTTNTIDWQGRAAFRVAHEERRYEAITRYMRFFQNRGWVSFNGSSDGIYVVAMFVSPDGKRIAKFADLETRDGWPEYACWACTQNNPHVPKFYTARTLRYGWFLGIMERLQPLPIDDYSDLDYAEYSDHLDDEMRATLLDARLLERAVLKIWGQPNSLMAQALIMRMGCKTFRAFARALIAQFKGNAADCHCGNIMLRGKTLVVIDPYAHRQTNGLDVLPAQA